MCTTSAPNIMRGSEVTVPGLIKIGEFISSTSGVLDCYASARRALVGTQSAIIVFHRVSPGLFPWFTGAVTPEDFRREISYVCKVGHVVPLDWLVQRIYEEKSIQPGTVCITFDDGFKDNYTFAYPILMEYSVPATIFLTTGYIGNGDIFPSLIARFAIWNTSMARFEMDGLGAFDMRTSAERASAMKKIEQVIGYRPKEANNLVETLLDVLHIEPPDDLGGKLMLSWDEIMQMKQNGISFGAHTATHPILSRVPLEEARGEITRSKEVIEQRLEQPCTLFAYPNGLAEDFNNEIVELVKQSAFTAAVTAIPGLLGKQLKDPFRLNRVSAGQSYHAFKCRFSGLYPDLIAAVNRLGGEGIWTYSK